MLNATINAARLLSEELLQNCPRTDLLNALQQRTVASYKYYQLSQNITLNTHVHHLITSNQSLNAKFTSDIQRP